MKHSSRNLLIAAYILGFAASSTSLLPAAELPAVSAPALFNEGNVAQRAGRLGPAILKYERAHLLAPGDNAIAQNLGIAREKAGVSSPSVPSWLRPAYWLGFNSLAVLASISLLLFSLHFYGAGLIPTDIRGPVRGLANLLGIAAIFAAGALALRWPDMDRAVIVSSSPAAARIAPAANASESFQVKPGEVVHVENTYGNFFRIHSTDGHVGWVSAAEIEKIVPGAS